MGFDFDKVVKNHKQMLEEQTSRQSTLYSSLLIASTSILGILCALRAPSEAPLYIRVVFVVSLLLFALGSLFLARILYDHVGVIKRARSKYSDECIRARHLDKAPKPVFVKPTRYSIVCEKLAYACLLSGLILLVIYTSLLTLVFC